MSPKAKTNYRSRSPRTEGDVGNAFESMWKNQFEAKLDNFKRRLREALKLFVVDGLTKFEHRMEAKLNQQAVAVQGVEEAVDRIELALAARASDAPVGNAASSFPPIPTSTYSQAAGAGVRAHFPGPMAAPFRPLIFPQKRSTNQSVGGALMRPKSLQALWEMSRLSWTNGSYLFQPWLQNVICPQACVKLQEKPSAAGLRSGSLETLAQQHTGQSNVLIPSNWVEANIRITLFFPPITTRHSFPHSGQAPCQPRKDCLDKPLLDILKSANPNVDVTLQRIEANIWADKRQFCSVRILSESEA